MGRMLRARGCRLALLLRTLPLSPSSQNASGIGGMGMEKMLTQHSFLDGLVLSLTPFHNSCNYRSAIVYGYASLVTDNDEALYAMKLITENLLPQRWDKSRTPPTPAELTSTSILRIRVASASAKIRVGGPSEDRADLKNSQLVKQTWTGVVPYWGTWGEPVPGKENGREEVEEYIEEWRVGETGKARDYAFEAIEIDGKAK